jgi:hypothetical protein
MNRRTIHPVRRAILGVDVEKSTMRTNPARAQMRRNIYTEFHKALQTVGIPPEGLDRTIDRGDGFLALFHPIDDVPMTTLISKLIPELAARIGRLPAGRGVRLRVTLHEGGVHYDEKGCFGEAVDVACKLLDARAVKRKLQEISGPLVLAITDHVYRTVVLHEYDGIDAATFKRIRNFRVGTQGLRAWVHAPRASDR